MIRRAALAALLLAAACTGSAPSERAGGAVLDAASPADLAPLVTELMPRLERLSGLDRIDTLQLRRQSREAARAFVKEQLDRDLPPAERAAMQQAYVMFGLLPDTLDLEALLLDLYTEQVLGYYDPRTRTMYVVEGADPASLRPVLAHELVHALQDQHTDLEALSAPALPNDRQLAAHAALEGHAMLVMFAVLAEDATGRPVDPAALPDPSLQLAPALRAQNDQFPVFRRAPAIIRETLLFPYLGGAGFVHALWSAQAPRDRYAAPIDSLLPRSTEQVLHPRDRFIAERDAPVTPELTVPGGWTVLRDNNLGELETGILLEHHLGPAARPASRGWDGDRYLLLTRVQGGRMLIWVSVWDSSAHADRFAAALRRAFPAASVHATRSAGQPAVRLVLELRD